MDNRMWIARELDKRFLLRFWVGSWVRHETPEEGLIDRNVVNMAMNMKSISLNILSDKNYLASSQKSKQIIRSIIIIVPTAFWYVSSQCEFVMTNVSICIYLYKLLISNNVKM